MSWHLRQMRIAGLDVGSKTIGLALSDALLITAQPVRTLARQGTRHDVAELAAWFADEGVAEVVIGWPLELDGREGHRALLVGRLQKALGRAWEGAIHRWDERLTTVAAQRAMLEADLSRKRRKKYVDKVAASLILQGYLDWRSKQESEPDD